MPLPRRRHVRLDRTLYSRYGTICSVTLAVAGRARVFADAALARAAVGVLAGHATSTGTPVYAYCVMPDHVHLVLGPPETGDIVTFAGEFKNLVQRTAWGLGVSRSFWQKSFWDHILRADEQVETALRYVLDNPVRAGLVERWQDYPFSGSLVFDLGRA